LVQGLKNFVVENTGDFAQLLVNTRILHIDFLPLTCIPEYYFVRVDIHHKYALLLGVVVVTQSDLSVEFE